MLREKSQNRIASERVMLGLSQQQLANELGVDRATVSRWEKHGKVPERYLIQLRSLFGCSIDWIVGVTDERLIVRSGS